MSNDQPHFLTPFLLAVDPQCSQRAAAKELLQKEGWKNLGNNPQLHWLNQEQETIKIETIRNLIAELAYASRGGQKRTFILLAADQLSSPAQHAFLKSLEEPPVNTQLILVTAYPQQLLGTIRSRCVTVKTQVKAVKNQPLPTIFNQLLTQPHDTTYQDLIKLANDYKDRAQAQELLEQALTQTKPRHQRQLLTSLKQVKANLNVRLALENCFFQLKKKMV